jgi:hypothetical protein
MPDAPRMLCILGVYISCLGLRVQEGFARVANLLKSSPSLTDWIGSKATIVEVSAFRWAPAQRMARVSIELVPGILHFRSTTDASIHSEHILSCISDRRMQRRYERLRDKESVASWPLWTAKVGCSAAAARSGGEPQPVQRGHPLL